MIAAVPARRDRSRRRGNIVDQVRSYLGDATSGVEVNGDCIAITGNAFYGMGAGIYIEATASFITVAGNVMTGNNVATSTGITLAGASSGPSIRHLLIADNITSQFNYGINVSNFATYAAISGNDFQDTTQPFSGNPPNTNNIEVTNNLGANGQEAVPAGGALALGPSPFDFRAGWRPETLYFGGTLTSVEGSITGLDGTDAAMASPYPHHMPPNSGPYYLHGCAYGHTGHSMTHGSTCFNSFLFNSALFGRVDATGQAVQVGSGLLYPALRKAAVTLGPQRTPSPAQFQDAIDELNRLLGSLNCDPLWIYGQDILSFPLTGKKIYTIGIDPTGSLPTSDFPVPVPKGITEAVYVDGTLRYLLAILTPQLWAQITLQDIAGGIPEGIYFDRGYPVANIYIYGQPAGGNLELYVWHLISSVAGVSDVIAVPRG